MTAVDWERLAASLDYPSRGPVDAQEEYVRTFDFDPQCSLEMGWQLFGERPERGALLASLREDLAAAQVSEGVDLPDHLPTLLRLMARRDAEGAAALAAVIGPGAERLLAEVRARHARFAGVLEAVVRALEQAKGHEEVT